MRAFNSPTTNAGPVCTNKLHLLYLYLPNKNCVAKLAFIGKGERQSYPPSSLPPTIMLVGEWAIAVLYYLCALQACSFLSLVLLSPTYHTPEEASPTISEYGAAADDLFALPLSMSCA